MIKSFLILISLQIILYSSQQVILVVSEGFDSPMAIMECYEGQTKTCGPFEVNIGKNGLGWGIGMQMLTQVRSDAVKYEGDKKAPAGIFKLSSVFGYREKLNLNMPYVAATDNLICVDDINSSYYNQIISLPLTTDSSFSIDMPQSYEKMKREDNQYELGIVVEHNKNGNKMMGSCIFIHVEKSNGNATAGCTSMSFEKISHIASWLDEKKEPILIQIPKSSAEEILNLYPSLSVSKLLN